MDAWTPLLKMLIAYTTIINDETIVIHGISINWFKKDGSVCGHFTLEKKWCDDRQIILSVLQRKKKGRKSDPPDPLKKSVLSSYICVRLNGYKLTDTVRSNLQKLGSKDLSDAWKTEIPLPSSASLIVHGIAGTTNIGRPSDTENYDVEFQVTQKSCELPDELFDNQEPVTCTVELIPKSEPEKRMEAALATIGNGGELVKTIVLQEPDFHIDDELQKILDHGKRKLDNKDVFVRRFNVDNESLNDSQKEAVRLALIQPFTVIQGPPGTGKTRTGACLTVLLADINREVKNKKQVLYCGPSNKSVDVIAMYLQKYKTKKMKFVRVYSDFIEELDFPIPGVESAERKFTRDIEEVQKTDIQKDSLHYLIRSHNCSFSVKIKQMYKKLKDGTLHPTLKNIRDYKALVKFAKIEVLKKMEVILCTCSASGHFILKENLDILQCVIDEAGMCFELDTLVPLVCHTPKQVVLIGDHKQLRPIVQEPRVKQLGADISLMEKYQGTAHTLSIQYRMHEEICKFPSKEFYDNQLVTDESVTTHARPIAKYIWPGKDRVPQVFCHIEGLEDTQTVKTSEGNENSRSNRIEAKEIVRVAKYLVDQRKVKPEDVAILSQYKLQCNIIHKMLQKTHPRSKFRQLSRAKVVNGTMYCCPPCDHYRKTRFQRLRERVGDGLTWDSSKMRTR
ncbi:putative helicase with zinc finger domain 2 isoform X1 [Apostichopus japonicus]|uniref:Putative helicase with zinc finger domain 2 isoform X1 n=1 Tax=Stichopus japonicus TaxID=307972 RepID=A0A2G8JWM8_STIJA|nr:putative helicase with zinc finger domain 2 isoform X1 [Apostichopus japonicus]